MFSFVHLDVFVVCCHRAPPSAALGQHIEAVIEADSSNSATRMHTQHYRTCATHTSGGALMMIWPEGLTPSRGATKLRCNGGRTSCMKVLLVEDVGQVALAAVLAVLVGSHEDAGTAVGVGALHLRALDLALTVHLVVLQGSQRHLLVLVRVLLRLGVVLLLLLLATTTQTQHQVQRALLLDVVVSEGAPVLQLLPGEDQTLLVRRNALLVLDLSLDEPRG
eukprot:TRINITY_DN279_c0_g1_i2.p1 TRINITY_DN279_c0_g1~~TRINITY_DN279_c0_g1_i2.p1  ORF type:complete len:221 (-),score=29.21 TRINITY_DN279_c0_g1_i2:215-877(-)